MFTSYLEVELAKALPGSGESSTKTEREALLNALAGDSWQLITVVFIPATGQLLAYLGKV